MLRAHFGLPSIELGMCKICRVFVCSSIENIHTVLSYVCNITLLNAICFGEIGWVFVEEDEGKPPIQVKFEIPYFTTSGIQVRYLKIIEKSGYQALPWVRYITQNGGMHR